METLINAAKSNFHLCRVNMDVLKEIKLNAEPQMFY